MVFLMAAPARAQEVLRLPGPDPSPGATKASAADTARALSVANALALAENASETVQLARAAVLRAQGQQWQARSQLLPQINASAGYTRTLATEFSSLRAAPDTVNQPPRPAGCTNAFEPTTGLSLTQRVDSLEKGLTCATTTNPFSAFQNLPFGRANQYNLGLTIQQTLFAGGRVWAQNRAASAVRRSAEISLNEARAELALEVTQAYYDALLSDRLLSIANASLSQAQQTLSQTKLAEQVGQKPEFELLRARVARDNQRPVVIQRQAARNQAFMRLKQLLDLPMGEPLKLTSQLGDSVPSLPPGLVRLASLSQQSAHFVPGDTSTAARAPVRAALQAVKAQQNQLDVARAERYPSLVLVSSYGKVAYPNAGLPSSWSQFRTNWTVGVSLQIPIFTGGRIHGDKLVAEAQLMQARAQLKQTHEMAALDTRSALDGLRSAEAAWQASAQTVGQAEKAYSIAEIRYNQGISTQLELEDSRIMLHQSEANRAQAARDLAVARARVLLLPFLPLGTASGASSAAQSGSASVGSSASGTSSAATMQSTQTGTAASAAGGAAVSAQTVTNPTGGNNR